MTVGPSAQCVPAGPPSFSGMPFGRLRASPHAGLGWQDRWDPAPHLTFLGRHVKTSTSCAAVALAASLALSACGSTGSHQAPGQAAASGSASQATLKPGDQVDGAALATRMTQAMVKAGSGTISMDLAATGKATGAFVMRQHSTDQHLSMTVQGQALEIVQTGGLIYMKGLPGSARPWVKIDPRGTDPLSTMFAGLTGQMSDPRQLAAALHGTKATVVSVAPDATVYDVTLDPNALLAATRKSASTPIPSLKPVRAHYTLDAQNRPTKLSVDAQGTTITVSFGGWGQPVTITAPPADQVGAFQLPAS